MAGPTLLVGTVSGQETAEGPLEPFLGESTLEMHRVFETERFPSIVVAMDGTVIATWGSSSVRARRSEDAGATWGEVVTIADPGFQGGGTIVDERSGDVLAFVESGHPPARPSVFRSRDRGRTWTAQEVEIRPNSLGHVPALHMNDSGITLRHGEHAGRLVRPTRWYADGNDRAYWPEHYTNAMFSDDGGRTWQTSEPFPEKGTGEATVAELADGRLYYNSRVHWAEAPKNTRRRCAWSTDGGATWKEWEVVEVLPDGRQDRSYGCMGGLVRMPVAGRDVLIFSNLDTPEPRRERITVWASFDGGESWPVKRLVFDGPSAYSSLTAGRPGTPSDGWIYLQFEGGPGGGCQVARFNLSWVLEGEPTGDGALPDWLGGETTDERGDPDGKVEVLLPASSPSDGGDPIDLERLLGDMLGRSRIAELPEPGFVCRQASSYDRRAREPGNADWFANSDSSHFVGCDEVDGRKEWILMDVDGPGAVVRWWTTQYRYTGTLRIYLDGSTEPVLVGKTDELIGGDRITGPPLNATRSWGRNLYLPLPFREHCKITYDGSNRVETGKFEDCLYYCINYVQYPEGTDVETFTMDALRESSELLDRVQKALLQPAEHSIGIHRTVPGGREALSPGDSLTREVHGPGAICRLRVRVAGDDVEQAMRSTVVRASFDGEQRVWAPVGGFFGSGPGLHPFKGWWRQVAEDGWMTCWWPMPFRDRAELSVVNHGTADVTVELDDIGVAEWSWTDRTMYFHCTWRGDHRIEVFGGDFTKAQEWNYATIDGKGVYVGDTLAIFNRPEEGPIGPWWGEGDEKIFVDGEPFPSHFGTGTEDYFGYAWGVADFFEAPFHAQPQGAGNTGIGHTTNTRVRVLDRIPFQSHLRFDMELSHWQSTRIDYATTAYWYALAGARGNGQVAPEKVRERVGEIAPR